MTDQERPKRRSGTTVVAFRAGDIGPGTLARHLAARADPALSPSRGWSAIAERDLGRLYELLEAEDRRLAVAFTEPEWQAIRDATTGTWFDPSSIRLLWAELEDAIALDRVDAKWDIDGPGLVEKLKALSPLQSLAIVDAVERWWRDQSAPPTQVP